MNASKFDELFQELTGSRPLSWQGRLYSDHFAKNDFSGCNVIDLPTGLGKTMVMAIWLIARAANDALPRRLIYVVDRRTVIDQATALVERWRERTINAAPALHNTAVSTMRGQLADNREWTQDPSRQAIIIGTVDMIGSRLLFSGYRSSYKRRPLEAGLLGQDSLLVLDEAHLSRPFGKLLASITQFQRGQREPMQVIRMSATSEGPKSDEQPFTLDTDLDSPTYDLKPNPDPETGTERNQIITRFGATKRLTTAKPVEPKKLNDALAEAALELAADTALIGKRIVVFVRSPEAANAIAKQITDHDRPGKSKANPNPKGPYAEFVELLTGTLRGLERDELVRKPVFENRWLNGVLSPSDESNQAPVFLISTSAGEVGFDLNADHMVSDQTTIDSFIQRLGRVNRRGTGDATIMLIPELCKRTGKDGKPRTLSPYEQAIVNTLDLLAEVTDLSPSAIASLKRNAWKDRYADACSPSPAMVELTDILLDAWSMTTIREQMPGRPEVGPWLRGIDEESPQTTIAWRAELELLAGDPDPKSKFKAIFATHRVRPHESLTTSSSGVVEFLQKITKGGRTDLRETAVVVKLSHDTLVKTVGELVDDPGIFFAEPTLILPASFGGLDENGTLSHDVIPAAPKRDLPSEQASFDVADIKGYESGKNVAPRCRILLERIGTEWKPALLPFARRQTTPIAETLRLEGGSYSRGEITDALRTKLGLRTREIIKFDLDEEGDPRKLLLLLTAVSPKVKPEPQLLNDHIGAVEAEANRIADDLKLQKRDTLREAMCFAAKWHDDGKRSPVWQRFIGGPASDGQPLGKSADFCDPKKLAGYRHEFGSLLRVLHPDPAEMREKPRLQTDETTRDLALHLIAVHHGHGRPHFKTPIDRDFHAASLIDEVHTESIRRFARLQRKYGWWRLAWLENLLRCADAIASAQINDDDIQDDDPEACE